MQYYFIEHDSQTVEFATHAAAEQYANANNINVENIQTSEKSISSELEAAQLLKCAEIDEKTQRLISQGFAFDGEQFSLSVRAQTNWLGLKVLENLLVFPVELTTHDDKAYYLEQADLNAFVGTGAAIVQQYLESGRALKGQVLAAQSLAEVDAVEDLR